MLNQESKAKDGSNEIGGTESTGKRPSRSRVLAALFGILAVAWPFLGFATGHFADVPAIDVWILVGVTMLVLVFTPAVLLVARWTALGAAAAGLVNLSSSLLAFIAAANVDFGRGVLAVLALFFTFFSIRAYRKDDWLPTHARESTQGGRAMSQPRVRVNTQA